MIDKPHDEPWRKVPFAHPVERLFCGRCGRQCVPQGHMFGRFLLCPSHGEFTVAPVVSQDRTGEWVIHFDDEGEMAMWDTCRHLDAQFPDGAPDGFARVKGLVPDGDVTP